MSCDLMRQVHIKCGNTNEICWVNDHPKLRKGCKLTLKDEGDELFWEVLFVSAFSVSKKTLYKTWHVGGL